MITSEARADCCAAQRRLRVVPTEDTRNLFCYFRLAYQLGLDMNSSKLNDWLQVIGLFGVIASLLFVGLQMMQDREIALSAIYQERAAVVTEFYTSIATDEVARQAMAKVNSGKSADLTPDELAAHQIIAIAGKQLTDNSHYQYEKGFASEDHWMQIRSTLKDRMRNPRNKRILLGGHMRPSFRADLIEIEKELEAEALMLDQ